MPPSDKQGAKSSGTISSTGGSGSDLAAKTGPIYGKESLLWRLLPGSRGQSTSASTTQDPTHHDDRSTAPSHSAWSRGGLFKNTAPCKNGSEETGSMSANEPKTAATTDGGADEFRGQIEEIEKAEDRIRIADKRSKTAIAIENQINSAAAFKSDWRGTPDGRSTTLSTPRHIQSQAASGATLGRRV